MKCKPGCTCGHHSAVHPGSSRTYAARHKRIYRVRGKASAHQCVRCPERAHDWAQVHGEDGEDPWADYVPMCRKCHLAYDRDARQNPESRKRWTEKAGPAIAAAWTPERRAAQSERMRQQRREGADASLDGRLPRRD